MAPYGYLLPEKGINKAINQKAAFKNNEMIDDYIWVKLI